MDTINENDSVPIGSSDPSTCGICWQPYSHNTAAPITLRCGHTFCKQCMVMVGRARGYAANCGTCRTKIYGDLKSLPKNFQLIELLNKHGYLREDPPELDPEIDRNGRQFHVQWGDNVLVEVDDVRDTGRPIFANSVQRGGVLPGDRYRTLISIANAAQQSVPASVPVEEDGNGNVPAQLALRDDNVAQSQTTQQTIQYAQREIQRIQAEVENIRSRYRHLREYERQLLSHDNRLAPNTNGSNPSAVFEVNANEQEQNDTANNQPAQNEVDQPVAPLLVQIGPPSQEIMNEIDGILANIQGMEEPMSRYLNELREIATNFQGDIRVFHNRLRATLFRMSQTMTNHPLHREISRVYQHQHNLRHPESSARRERRVTAATDRTVPIQIANRIAVPRDFLLDAVGQVNPGMLQDSNLIDEIRMQHLLWEQIQGERNQNPSASGVAEQNQVVNPMVPDNANTGRVEDNESTVTAFEIIGPEPETDTELGISSDEDDHSMEVDEEISEDNQGASERVNFLDRHN